MLNVSVFTWERYQVLHDAMSVSQFIPIISEFGDKDFLIQAVVNENMPL